MAYHRLHTTDPTAATKCHECDIRWEYTKRTVTLLHTTNNL